MSAVVVIALLLGGLNTGLAIGWMSGRLFERQRRILDGQGKGSS